MKFNSKSVTLLQNGVQCFIELYVPLVLLDYSLDDSHWKTAIQEFNSKLDARPSVTFSADDLTLDILQMEIEEKQSIEVLSLRVVAKQEDLRRLEITPFQITGHLTFKPGSDTIEKMVIDNVTFGGDDHKKFRLFNDSDK